MSGPALLPALLRQWHDRAPGAVLIILPTAALFLLGAILYLAVYTVAPLPRSPISSEVLFRAIEKDGSESEPKPLPCWQYKYFRRVHNGSDDTKEGKSHAVEPAEVTVSIVVPAFNEQRRLPDMLKETVEFLNHEYPSTSPVKVSGARRRGVTQTNEVSTSVTGWEVIVVSDGSTDNTRAAALDVARDYPGSNIRVVELKKNRGKGGAVLHGMRHVRGEYIVFADADGASKIEDLTKLVQASERIRDTAGRAVAIGSRAHLVGSAAVVNRSRLRNLLMHGFHILLWLMTPAATSKIKDTQCGFKLFTRASLPFIVPHVHAEGWIFDVEMLMLAERASIPMAEVAIGWHEVQGSKLNVVKDSIGMAWSLLVLRLAWGLGVYQTEVQAVTLEELKPNAHPIPPPKLPTIFSRG